MRLQDNRHLSQQTDFKSLGFASEAAYQFPAIINVEVYRGRCPCNCVHCPVGLTPPEKRSERFGDEGISLPLFKKIIQEVSRFSNSIVRLHSEGEPILWENLTKALAFASQHNVKTWVFTCAVTNDTTLLESLCQNASIIEVSVNSTTPEDYLATKGVDAFSLVYGNISLMRKIIDERKLPTRLIVSRVQSFEVAKDDEFVTHWKSSGLVDDAFVRSYHNYNEMIDLHENGTVKKVINPCLVHWARFNVGVKGQAVVCFNELFKTYLDPAVILGDLNHQMIQDIWQGDQLNQIRLAELSGDYSSSLAEKLPCKECTSCQSACHQNNTSECQLDQLGNTTC